MTAYYNEHNAHAAAWLRKLIKIGAIAPGEVDERSIADVTPSDLAGYKQCHFFAGIGGWSLALRLAGIPDDCPIWTGSCPCQPYSAAGKGKGDKDERNLWPEFFRLIRECRPVAVAGEQVAAAIRHGWLDGISADLEGEGYTVGAAVLGAHSAGSPHIRQRLYWMADAGGSERREERASDISGPGRGDAAFGVDAEGGCLADARSEPGHQSGISRVEGGSRVRRNQSAGGSDARPVADTNGNGRRIDQPEREPQRGTADRRANSGADPVADTTGGEPGCGELGLLAPDRCLHGAAGGEELSVSSAWSDYDIVHCRDGKARRVGRGVFPLVDGLPADLGRRFPELRRLLARARSGRTGRLKGYGNAIVPQVAAEFVRAWMEVSGN